MCLFTDRKRFICKMSQSTQSEEKGRRQSLVFSDESDQFLVRPCHDLPIRRKNESKERIRGYFRCVTPCSCQFNYHQISSDLLSVLLSTVCILMSTHSFVLFFELCYLNLNSSRGINFYFSMFVSQSRLPIIRKTKTWYMLRFF